MMLVPSGAFGPLELVSGYLICFTEPKEDNKTRVCDMFCFCRTLNFLKNDA